MFASPFVSPPRTTEEALTRARNEIVRHGWAQEVARDNRGRVCAQEAIMTTCRGDSRMVACATDALMGVIQIRYPERQFCHIPSWNDANERTCQEVLDTFDQAIAFAHNPVAALATLTVPPVTAEAKPIEKAVKELVGV